MSNYADRRPMMWHLLKHFPACCNLRSTQMSLVILAAEQAHPEEKWLSPRMSRIFGSVGILMYVKGFGKPDIVLLTL